MLSLLANHWAARGEDVSVITIDSGATDCYALDPRVGRIALGLRADSAGPVAAVINNWRRLRALRSALAATRATTVLSFGEYTNVQVLFATRFKRLRCVVSERTDPALHPIAPIWHFLRRVAYPFADALVVQTPGLLSWARQVVGRRRAHVIANPVHGVRSRPATRTEKEPTVIAAGRLVPVKGFDLLLRAFAHAVETAPAWRLVILGEGPERERLAELARSLRIEDRVSLPGWIADPTSALERASIFVLPSRYEGFPNALVEAMACALPVVATACLGPAHIITHGHDGLLVPVDSVSELTAAIRELVQDEARRARLGANAAAVCTRYKLESIVQQWDSLLTGTRECSALRHSAASE